MVSFVPHSANKYPKQKKPRTASSTDQKPLAKAAQAPRTLLKAGELVHVATDVPLTAQQDMFGAVDSSTFQVTAYMLSCSAWLWNFLGSAEYMSTTIIGHFNCNTSLHHDHS